MRSRAFATIVLALGFGGGCAKILGLDKASDAVECVEDDDCAVGRCVKYLCVTNGGAAGSAGASGSPGGGNSASGGIGGAATGGTVAGGTAGAAGIGGQPTTSGGAAGTGGLVGGTGGSAAEGGSGGAMGGAGAEFPGGAGGNVGGAVPSGAGVGGDGAAGSGGETNGGGGAATTGGEGGDPNGGEAGGPPSCLTITPWPPPAPCAGQHYDMALSALGGEGPYTWTAITSPDGMSLSAEGHLSGTDVASGTLTVTVEDGTGLCAGERTIPLFSPRDTCWLAYIANEGDGTKLFLYDELAHRQTGSTYKLSFPTSAEATAVSDFAFSPDGRFLAYRLGDNPTRLFLLTGPTWTELELYAGQGSVVQYAWSPDSSALALAFVRDTDGMTYLGGARVSQSASPSGEAGAAGASAVAAPGVSELTPIEAQVDSELVWFESEWVAFHAPFDDPDGAHSALITKLDVDGFRPAMWLEELAYNPSMQLWPADGGFYAIDQDVYITYWRVPPGTTSPNQVLIHDHYLASVVAPSGLYVAATTGTGTGAELRVYENEDSQLPLATAQNCPFLLAWAKGRERIACVVNDDANGRVYINELAGNPPALLSAEVNGGYEYLGGQAFGQRRAFSDDGTRFAFTSRRPIDGETYVYVAILDGGTPYLDTPIPDPFEADGDTTELAFAPDRSALLVHLDSRLLWRSLNSTIPAVYLNASDETMASPVDCREDFLAAPDKWCGNARNHEAEFLWSPESRWVAYRTQEQKLMVVDLIREPTTGVPVEATCNDPCESELLGRFEFQPLASW